jgi:hypothetical protein
MKQTLLVAIAAAAMMLLSASPAMAAKGVITESIRPV